MATAVDAVSFRPQSVWCGTSLFVADHWPPWFAFEKRSYRQQSQPNAARVTSEEELLSEVIRTGSAEALVSLDGCGITIPGSAAQSLLRLPFLAAEPEDRGRG